jgi:transposase
MVNKLVRGKYTLEYKLEAIRQVKAGQSSAVVAKVLGIPAASLGNWIGLEAKGQLGDVQTSQKAPVVTVEQTENARLKMERDIAKKAAAYFAQDVLQSTLGSGK